MFVCQLSTILASLLLWLLPRDAKGGLLYGVFTLASFGGGYAVLMGMQIANTAGYTKRSVSSSGLFVGYCLGMFSCLPRASPCLAPQGPLEPSFHTKGLSPHAHVLRLGALLSLSSHKGLSPHVPHLLKLFD